MEQEVAVKLENHEQRLKVSEHRIADLEDATKSIQDLVLSVDRLAQNMEATLKELQIHNQRLHELERQPGEMWNSAKKTAFTSCVSAVAGGITVAIVYLLSRFML